MKRVYKQGIGVGVVVLMAALALALVNRGCVAHRETGSLATIKTDYGDITVRLLMSEAPNTAATFARLAREKFYDGLSFSLVNREAGLIAGGQAPPDRQPTWHVPMEDNDVPFERGSVAMFDPRGRSSDFTSTFLIALSSRPGLAGQVTIFGKVVGGMDTVDDRGGAVRAGRSPQAHERYGKERLGPCWVGRWRCPVPATRHSRTDRPLEAGFDSGSASVRGVEGWVLCNGVM